MKKSIKPELIIALDFNKLSYAVEFLDQIDPSLCKVKVGKELFLAEGKKCIQVLRSLGFDVFLDLKFHDIPNTVAKACMVAADLGCWMVNVHVSGGRRMMEAAAEVYSSLRNPPILVGVTMLTSLTEIDLKELGFVSSVEEQVKNMAQLAMTSGLKGVVCSAVEARFLSSLMGENFVLVTPGIRLSGDNLDDQKRVVSPIEAADNGSHFLVVGRSLTTVSNPLEKVLSIQNMLRNRYESENSS